MMKQHRQNRFVDGWKKRFSPTAPMNIRLYYLICLLALFFSASLLYVVLNAVSFQPYKIITIVFSAFIALSATYHFFSKYNYTYGLIATVIICFIIIPAIFLCSAGVKGGGLFLFIFGIFFLTVVVKRKFMYLILVLFTEYVSMMFLSLAFPRIVFINETTTSVTAIVINFLIVSLIIYIFLRIIITGYHKEHKQLRITNEKLNHELITDDLTGIFNHRYIASELIRAVAEANENSELFLLMYDIDDFKTVNDEYGHTVGNDILYEVAQMIDSEIGKEGVCARYGGEEFVVLFKNKNAEEVFAIAEKIRKSVESKLFIPDTNKKITVSCGIAKYKMGDNAEEFLRSVDFKMYSAKHQGKNQTVFY